MLTCRRDGIRWTLREEFQPLLEAVLASPATTVRESPVRTVTLHRVDGRSYYIKRYWIGRSPWRRLIFLIRKPPAQAQWEVGLRLESLGLPVVRFLACGVRRSLQGIEESVLITEGFEGTPIGERVMSDGSAILRFVQALHDRGVIQPDLHTGNVLFSSETGELRLVDVGHVRFKRTVGAAERVENLAFLRLSVPIRLSPEGERLSRELRKRVYRHRSKRCLKTNREFGPQPIGSLVWQVRRRYFTPFARCVVDDPDQFLSSEARLMKAGRTTTIGCRYGLVLKRFNLVKRLSLVKDLFRGSRAKRSFRLAYHLELLGIPTPRPLAFAERRKAGFLLSSYLLTEEVPGARTLAAFDGVGTEVDREVVKNLATLIASLHNEGFSHRDLKATNFLVGAAGRVFLLDLDGLRFRKAVSEAVTGANLARFARAVVRIAQVGRAERLAFLLRYYRTRGLRRIPAAHRRRTLLNSVYSGEENRHRWVHSRRDQRRLDRLSEIQTAPATGQHGTVLAVLITSRPDPQRPSRVIDDYARYMRPWWNSVNRIGLRGVVLHDGLPERFLEKAATPHVRFVRMDLGPWPILLERYRMVRDYLRTIDDELVFSTDICDVAFRRDPFDLVRADPGRHRLFIGSQPQTIGQSRFMRDEMISLYGGVPYTERRIVNTGILGSLREEVLEFLDRLLSHISEIKPRFPRTEMGIVNKVVYDHYRPEELMTGFPLHSEFGAWELNTSAAIIHK